MLDLVEHSRQASEVMQTVSNDSFETLKLSRVESKLKYEPGTLQLNLLLFCSFRTLEVDCMHYYLRS